MVLKKKIKKHIYLKINKKNKHIIVKTLGSDKILKVMENSYKT